MRSAQIVLAKHSMFKHLQYLLQTHVRELKALPTCMPSLCAAARHAERAQQRA